MAAFIVLNFFKCYKGNHSFVQCFLDNLVNSVEIKTKNQENQDKIEHTLC